MTPPASTARSAHRSPARPRPVPRRASGPLRPAVAAPGGSVALPRPGRPLPLPARLGRRLRALPDGRLVTRLLTGRAWIPLVAVLLFGLVTMQVHLLKLNTGISRAVETSARLARENAAMRASIGRLSSGERQRAVALRNGLVDPAAGSARFLRVKPGDASRAARAVARPGDTNGISTPAAPAAPVAPVAPAAPVAPVTPAVTATPTVAATAGTTPAASATAPVVPAATTP